VATTYPSTPSSGIVSAGIVTYLNRMDSLSGWNNLPKHDRFEDPISQRIHNILECYGSFVIKPSLIKKKDSLHTKAVELLTDIRSRMPAEKHMFIDSGGFQIVGGRLRDSINVALPNLIDIYTRFIAESDQTFPNTSYFYLDIPPVFGITPSESRTYMDMFHTKLMERTVSNGRHRQLFFIYQANSPISFRVFRSFLKDNNIASQLDSHKWAMGGLVPINMNDFSLWIRPYMIPLFEIIPHEYQYLRSGGEVCYHVLGVSSMFDFLLFCWMIVFNEYHNFNLKLTFDSTTSIYLATKSGIVHHIDPDTQAVVPVSFGYSEIMKYNTNRYNRDYIADILNTVRTSVGTDESYLADPSTWFDENNRWTAGFLCSMCAYEFSAYAHVFHVMLDHFRRNKLCVLQDDMRDLVDMSISILKQLGAMPKDFARFQKMTLNSLMRSFVEYKTLMTTGQPSKPTDHVVDTTMAKFTSLNTDMMSAM